MLRVKPKTSTNEKSKLNLLILLLFVSLLKLGSLPIVLLTFPKYLKFPEFSVKRKRGRPSKKSLNSTSLLPSFHDLALIFKTLTLGFIPFRRAHPGRPRKRILLFYYLGKVNKVFSYLLPRKKRFKILITLSLILIISYSFFLVKLAASLPSPYQLLSSPTPLTTQIYDRNGTLLFQIYEGRNRKLISLKDLPTNLVNATVAIEDKHFYYHPGVDLTGILRALENNFSTESLQGGSTITQQLIKNTVLSPERNFSRKVKEVLLAFWAERIYSKQEILQAYFNESPYGGPAWGIQAASEMYFGKNASELDLAQSSYLAGLPASPTELSPYGTHPERGKSRQKEVLRRMAEDGYITLTQADEAYAQKLDFRPPTSAIKAPHFVMYIRSLLAQKYGERVVSQGGLKVVTSLDLSLQQMAEEVVASEIQKVANLNVGNGGALITNPKTGEILAMVGSKDYFEQKVGNYNVTLATRQPGSSIKPITYAAAFIQGYSPGTILLDAPITFRGIPPYTPVNYDGRFHGPVTIRTALGSSYNIPAVKTLSLVGVPAVVELAREMGLVTLEDPSKYGLSFTLGGGATRMLDMNTAYGVFANNGLRVDPKPVLSVEDSEGHILESNSEAVGTRVLPEEVAYLINNVLSDKSARTPAFGPLSALDIQSDTDSKKFKTVAVKTGTSDSKRDNWTFGYTPEVVVGVWVGNNDNSPMDPRLASGITGAAPIWNRIMTNLLKGKDTIAYIRPPGIVERLIDGKKDLTVSAIPTKSIISQRRVRQRDEVSGSEKEVTTYSDSFNSFTPGEVKATQ